MKLQRRMYPKVVLPNVTLEPASYPSLAAGRKGFQGEQAAALWNTRWKLGLECWENPGPGWAVGSSCASCPACNASGHSDVVSDCRQTPCLSVCLRTLTGRPLLVGHPSLLLFLTAMTKFTFHCFPIRFPSCSLFWDILRWETFWNFPQGIASTQIGHHIRAQQFSLDITAVWTLLEIARKLMENAHLRLQTPSVPALPRAPGVPPEEELLEDPVLWEALCRGRECAGRGEGCMLSEADG